MQKYRDLVNAAYYSAMSFHRGNNQPIPTKMYRVHLSDLSDVQLTEIINSYKNGCSVTTKATTKVGV